jgi:hypothetical protein
MLAHIFSLIGIILSVVGLGFILIDVVPVQLRELPTQDDYRLIRKLLPVLTLTFVFFASLTTIYLGYKFVHNSPSDPLRDTMRFIILFTFFITGLSWKLIYRKG